MAKKSVPSKEVVSKTKERLSQSDVPAYGLEDALRVARAIADNYACQPTRAIAIAQAMSMSPTSGPFRMLCGASIAYGLTEGGYNASMIALTELGKKIVKPLEEGTDFLAKREAALKPKVIGEFLKKYNGNKLPKLDIANNVLESMGVPGGRAGHVFKMIIDTAQQIGFLREINGVKYIDLHADNSSAEAKDASSEVSEQVVIEETVLNRDAFVQPSFVPTQKLTMTAGEVMAGLDPKDKRVFITHGKNKSLVPQIKEILSLVDFVPVVSVENGTVSKPVPDKVMDDMRSCRASIIHIDVERKLAKEDGTTETFLNQNVLIEIGASMALYGTRFVLLVQEGVELPSNLQRLYQVWYQGEKLDAETAINLMKVFHQIKNANSVGFFSNSGSPQVGVRSTVTQ